MQRAKTFWRPLQVALLHRLQRITILVETQIHPTRKMMTSSRFFLRRLLAIASARSTPKWIIRKGPRTFCTACCTSQPISNEGEMPVSECSPGGWCGRKEACSVSPFWEHRSGGCHMPLTSDGTGTDCIQGKHTYGHSEVHPKSKTQIAVRRFHGREKCRPGSSRAPPRTTRRQKTNYSESSQKDMFSRRSLKAKMFLPFREKSPELSWVWLASSGNKQKFRK